MIDDGVRRAEHSIVRVELSTGNRTIVSRDHDTSPIGEGVALVKPGLGIALSPAGTTAYVVSANAIISVDLSNGNRTILSIAPPFVPRGTGPAFDVLRDIALNSTGTIAYVVDDSLEAIFRVDLVTGNRTIVSNSGKGTGPAFDDPHSIVLDSAGTTAYVVDNRLDAIFHVDLVTGNRTIVSDDDTGTGTNFGIPNGIALAPAGTTAYVSDFLLDTIFHVDLSSGVNRGNRTLPFDLSVGSGIDLNFPTGIALDSAGTTAYVISFNSSAIFSVDLTTGDRTIVSSGDTSPPVGIGPAFDFPWGIVLNPVLPQAYVMEASVDALFSIDLSTGDRTIVSSSTVGTGPAFANPRDIALNSAGTTAYVLDSALGALFSIDLSTGDRTIVSSGDTSPAVGIGPAFKFPRYIVINSAGTMAYVTDYLLDALISVDLTTGDRTIVSDDDTGTGNDFSNPIGIALNSTDTIAYFLDEVKDILFSVDLSNGNRTVISGSDRGEGINLGQPRDIVLNPINDTAYLTRRHSISRSAILSVNLSTGDRFIVSQVRR